MLTKKEMDALNASLSNGASASSPVVKDNPTPYATTSTQASTSPNTFITTGAGIANRVDRVTTPQTNSSGVKSLADAKTEAVNRLNSGAEAKISTQTKFGVDQWAMDPELRNKYGTYENYLNNVVTDEWKAQHPTTFDLSQSEAMKADGFSKLETPEIIKPNTNTGLEGFNPVTAADWKNVENVQSGNAAVATRQDKVAANAAKLGFQSLNAYRTFQTKQYEDTQTKNAADDALIPINNALSEYGKLQQQVNDLSAPNYGAGNIDLSATPRFDNGDGTYSTVDSMSFHDDKTGLEILIPTVININGQWYHVDEADAIEAYRKSGQYLGAFRTVEEADDYAIRLHEQQEELFGKRAKLSTQLAAAERLIDSLTEGYNNGAGKKYLETHTEFLREYYPTQYYLDNKQSYSDVENVLKGLDAQISGEPAGTEKWFTLKRQYDILEQNKMLFATDAELDAIYGKERDAETKAKIDERTAELVRLGIDPASDQEFMSLFKTDSNAANRLAAGQEIARRDATKVVEKIQSDPSKKSGRYLDLLAQYATTGMISDMEALEEIGLANQYGASAGEINADILADAVRNALMKDGVSKREASNAVEVLLREGNKISTESMMQSLSDAASANVLNGAALTVLSFATNLASGFGLAEAGRMLGSDSTLGTLDPNSRSFAAANATNAIRSGITEAVDWKVDGVDLFDEAYGIITSGVDSYLASLVPGGSTIIGMNAAAESLRESAERGASLGESIVTAAIAGTFEGLFEDVSISQLKAFREVEAVTWGQVFGNLKKSLATNFEEEAATTLANSIFDWLKNTPNSNFNTSIGELMTQINPDTGRIYTEKEARAKTWAGIARDVFHDGITGAIQGVFMGAAAQANSISRVRQVNKFMRTDAEQRGYIGNAVLAASYTGGKCRQIGQQFTQGLKTIIDSTESNETKRNQLQTLLEEMRSDLDQLPTLLRTEAQQYAGTEITDAVLQQYVENVREMDASPVHVETETEEKTRTALEANGFTDAKTTDAIKNLVSQVMSGRSNLSFAGIGNEILDSQEFRNVITEVTGRPIIGKGAANVKRSLKAIATTIRDQSVEVNKPATPVTAQDNLAKPTDTSATAVAPNGLPLNEIVKPNPNAVAGTPAGANSDSSLADMVNRMMGYNRAYAAELSTPSEVKYGNALGLETDLADVGYGQTITPTEFAPAQEQVAPAGVQAAPTTEAEQPTVPKDAKVQIDDVDLSEAEFVAAATANGDITPEQAKWAFQRMANGEKNLNDLDDKIRFAVARSVAAEDQKADEQAKTEAKDQGISEAQYLMQEALNIMLSDKGFKIKFVPNSELPGLNGEMDLTNGILYINASAPNVDTNRMSGVAWVIGHEITHETEQRIKDKGGVSLTDRLLGYTNEDTGEFVPGVLQALAESGAIEGTYADMATNPNAMKAAIEELRGRYGKYYVDKNMSEADIDKLLTDKYLREEIAGDFLGTLLGINRYDEQQAKKLGTKFKRADLLATLAGIDDTPLRAAEMTLRKRLKAQRESGLRGKAFRQAYDTARGQMQTLLDDVMTALENPREFEYAGTRESIANVNGKPIAWVENSGLTNAQLKDYQAIADYIADHIGEYYTILESGQKVYIGDELPDEYTQSKYTSYLKNNDRRALNAKNKGVNVLGDMIEIATNRRWEPTNHTQSKDAKYGMYRYDSEFAFPLKNGAGDTVGARAYDVELLIRNASDGKKYLYDIVNIKENTPDTLDLTDRETRKGGYKAATWGSASDDSINDTTEDVNTKRESVAGQTAAKADLKALQHAMELEAKGKDVDTIFKSTHWWKDESDGKWRFEVNDSNAKFRRNVEAGLRRDPAYEALRREYRDLRKRYNAGELSGDELDHFNEVKNQYLSQKNANNEAFWRNGGKIGDVVDHKLLFEQYPALMDVPFEFNESMRNDDTGGWYIPGLNKIELNPRMLGDGTKAGDQKALDYRMKYINDISEDVIKDEEKFVLSILLHEMQHQIQHTEGFTFGGNMNLTSSAKNAAERGKKYYGQKLDDAYSNYGVSARSAYNDLKRGNSVDVIDPRTGELKETITAKTVELSDLQDALYRWVDAEKALGSITTRDANALKDIMRDFAQADYDYDRTHAWINGKPATQFNLYQALRGEQESRNTQDRQNMTAKERYYNRPILPTDFRTPTEMSDISGRYAQSGKRKDLNTTRASVASDIATDNPVRTLSYFSGGGLFDHALRQVIDSKGAVEWDKGAAAIYQLNNGDVFVGDVRDYTDKELDKLKGQLDYFHASPVCKNYSRMNRNRGELSDSNLDMETAKATANAIEKVMPKVFTLEQVPEYQGSEALKSITDTLDKLGYKWDTTVAKASDYGGATSRERLLLRAVRDGELPPLPEKTPGRTWLEATSDLIEGLPEAKLSPHLDEKIRTTPGLQAALANQTEPILILGGTPGGQAWWASADQPSPSITTKMDEARVLMPDGRILKATPRFFARIMGLPDSYQFTQYRGNDNQSQAYKVIGNGIPAELVQKFFGNLLDDTMNTGVRYSVATNNSNGESLSEGQQNYFKDSHAVDDNNQLLVLYHGGSGRTVYNGRGKGFTYNPNAIYLTDSPEVANAFAGRGGTTQRLYANVTNPLILDAQGHGYTDIPIPEDAPQSLREKFWYDNTADLDNLPVYAAEHGYDGVIVKNVVEGVGGEPMTEVVALHPEQVKNTDNLNPTTNPDIRYSVAANQQQTPEERRNAAVQDMVHRMLAQGRNAPTGTPTPPGGRVAPMQASEDGLGAARFGFTQQAAQDYEDWMAGARDVHPISDTQQNNRRFNRANRDAVQYRKTVDDSGKVTSRAAQTIRNAGITTDSMAQTLDQAVANGAFDHIPYRDNKAYRDAENDLKRNGWAAEYAKYKENVDNGITSKKNTVMGIALYNNAVTEGDNYAALDIASLMIRNASNTAASLQAQQMLNKLGPDGQLYMAVRGIENIADSIRKLYPDKNIDVDRSLIEAYRNALIAEDQDAIDAARADIIQAVADQLPADWREQFNNWRYMAMLTNPATHFRNMLGNTGFAIPRMMKQAMKAGLERVVIGKAGEGSNRTTAILNPFAAADRARFTAGWGDYDNVVDLIQSGGKQTGPRDEIEKKRTIFNIKGKEIKGLEAVRRFNTNALDLEDTWFSRPAYAEALASYLKARGIDGADFAAGNISDQDRLAAQEHAIREAQKATYRDRNQFSDLVANLGKAGRAKNATTAQKIGSAVIEAVLPFKRTPANIVARAWEYSPAEIVNIVFSDIGKIRRAQAETRALEAESDGSDTAIQAINNAKETEQLAVSDMLDHIASASTGTALLALGAMLRHFGILHGGADKDEEQAAFDTLQGQQEYSINIGGKNYTLDWLAPEVLPVFTGVALYDKLIDRDEGDGNGIIGDLSDILLGMTEPMLNMSMLSSVNNLISNVKYIKQAEQIPNLAKNVGLSYLSQYVPTVFGKLESTFWDAPQERTATYIDKESALGKDEQYFLGKLANKVPGWEYNQVKYYDAWGRPQDNGNVLQRVIANMVSPGYLRDDMSTPYDEELQRLHDAGVSHKVFPQRASQSTKVDGEFLTAPEYELYTKTQGETQFRLISDLLDSRAYQHMNDDERAAAISEVYSDAKKTAMNAVRSERGVSVDPTDAENAGMDASKYIIANTTYTNAVTPKGYKTTSTGNTPTWAKMLAVLDDDSLSKNERLEFVNAKSGKNEDFKDWKEAKDYYTGLKEKAKK